MSKTKQHKPQLNPEEVRKRPKPAPESDFESELETQGAELPAVKSPALTAGQVLHLQRMIGNQAVQRMLGRKGSAVQRRAAAPVKQRSSKSFIQRWDLTQDNVPLGTAESVGTVSSGQAVFFLTDNTNEKIVAKGETVEIGKTQLAGMLYKPITSTSSVRTKDVTSQRGTLKGLIADEGKLTGSAWDKIVDEPGARYARTLKGQHPDWSAKKIASQFHQDQLDALSYVQVMDFAPGKRADVLAGGGSEGGEKTWRELMRSNTYMLELGKVTAVDLFLENADRVMAGNFGNWMTDAKTGAMTLIDNLDAGASGMWSGTDPKQGNIGKTDNLKKLAPGKLKQTAKEAVDSLIGGMKDAGDATVDEWASAASPSNPDKTRKEMMELTFLDGLKEGRSMIIRVLLKKKMNQTGRAIKAQAIASSGTDKPGVDYWTRLKARVRYLNKLK